MYIIKNTDNLPVKNIIFESTNGFELRTRYIDSNICEVGLFKINNPQNGWRHVINITYYEKDKPYKKNTITFHKSNISSQVKTLKTEFILEKSTFDDLPAKFHENKNGNIPQVIFQTHKQYQFGKREYYDASRSWILKNPGYTYIFYDNNDCKNFIQLFFPPSILQAWKSLIHGALKADIFRYCVLYILGGFYVDFDTICVVNLDRLYNKDTVFITAREPNYKHLWNAFIGVQKNSPIINLSINMATVNVLKRIRNIDTLSLTGPGVLGKALNITLNRSAFNNYECGYLKFKNKQNIILYQNNLPPNWTMTANNRVILISKWNGYQSDNYWTKNWYK